MRSGNAEMNSVVLLVSLELNSLLISDQRPQAISFAAQNDWNLRIKRLFHRVIA